MSQIGFWVGIGDASKEETARRAKEAAEQRDIFAGDLERVALSDDWPEQARVVAAQMRRELYSNPKLKPKDYKKLWEQVHLASGRPGVQSAETATAQSDIPAMGSLRDKMDPSAVPPPNQDGLTMRPESSSPSLDLLRPSTGPATGSFMNMRPEPSAEPNLVQPRSFTDAVDQQQASSLATVATAPPPATIYGPRTRAEKNVEAATLFKQNQALQLDTFRKQREIESELRPDKWVATAGGEVIYNQQDGTFRNTEFQKPTNPTEMESHVSDLLAMNGKPDTPENRVWARDLIRAKNAELVRDDSGAAMRDEKWRMSFDAMTARFDAQERDRILSNALVIRKQFERDTEPARLSLRMARDLEVAANAATRGGDFVALYNLVKSVDPQSVVREGEVRLLQSMLSTWANIETMARRLSGSTAALPNEARVAAKQAAQLLKQAALGKWEEAIMVAESDSAARQVQPGLVGIQEIDPGTFTIRPRRYGPATLPQPQWPGRGGVAAPPGATPPPAAGGVVAPPGGLEAAILKALGD